MIEYKPGEIVRTKFGVFQCTYGSCVSCDSPCTVDSLKLLGCCSSELRKDKAHICWRRINLKKNKN